jgi:hypothetical protein
MQGRNHNIRDFRAPQIQGATPVQRTQENFSGKLRDKPPEKAAAARIGRPTSLTQ